ncbi:MAG: hypothetical protein ACI9RU_001745 [Litorivivens sp.]|jgi:hypothetical protein
MRIWIERRAAFDWRTKYEQWHVAYAHRCVKNNTFLTLLTVGMD